MKKTHKRILAVLTAAMLLVSCSQFSILAVAVDHTHAYHVETVVAPGYQFGGYTVYRCSCGDSYMDDYTSPIEQPYCVLTGGKLAPGDSITVQAVLHNCSGLQDLTLDLFFDMQLLRLTDVQCAAYGVPEFLSDRTLYFSTIDPAAQQATLLLTFAVSANAPTGELTVSASGCGVSSLAADNGEEIFLTTVQSAVLTVYRPFVMAVNAPEEPLFAGDTVRVTVDLSENTGVAGMSLALHYDPDVLTLTAVGKCGMFNSGSTVMSGTISAMPYRILWDDAAAHGNHTENGTILELTFTVNDSAEPSTTQVYVTFDASDVLDTDLNPVELTTSGAQLSIVDHICGDADGDRELDLTDVVLISRYLAQGWDVEIDTDSSDVDGDGAVTLKDAVLIRRYLAGGWGVVLV